MGNFKQQWPNISLVIIVKRPGLKILESSKQILPVHRWELVATASVPLQNFSDSENRVIVVSVRDTVDSSAISKQLLEDPEVVFVFCTRVSV